MAGTIRIQCAKKLFERHAKGVRKAAEACLFVLCSPTKTNAKKGEHTPSESRSSGMTRGYIAHHVEIHIFLIKDEEMKTINRKFRRKNKATNVLSFQEPEGFPRPDTREKKCLGEVYLAPQYIKKHAENMEELVIHGILHLLGYTHERVRDRIEMEKKERSILKKFQNANF